MIKILWSLFFCLNAFAHHHRPPSDSGTATDLVLRLFYPVSQFNSLLEIKSYDGKDDNNPLSLRAGGKWRIGAHFKLGGYISYVRNQRHDNDWIWANGEWMWRDSKNRSETHFTLEPTLRFILPADLVMENRAQYIYNEFNQHQSLKYRLGLNRYFSCPTFTDFSLFLQQELYFPLNFSESKLYEHWTYFGSLFHLDPVFKPGLSLAYMNSIWTTSEETRLKGEDPYKTRHRMWVVSLFLNIYMN